MPPKILATVPPKASIEPGLVVPMPMLPLCNTVTAGVEKVEPSVADEGVISKALFTLY